jgi:hypothetical protein
MAWLSIPVAFVIYLITPFYFITPPGGRSRPVPGNEARCRDEL